MPDLELTPTADQYTFFERKEKLLYAIAGIQGGKTFLGAMWSSQKIAEYPNSNGLICAPTYKILHQSTLPKFFEIFPPAKQWYRKGDSELVLPSGKKVFLRSTEEPDRIEGMTIAWAWADEIGQMKREAHTNLQGRLSIENGQLLGTTTPYAMNWLYHDVYKPWEKGQTKGVFIHQWRSVDNPFFPKEEYERAKTTFDERTFSRRYEGKFEKMEGLIYDDFDEDFHIKPDLPKGMTKNSPFIIGRAGAIDFGYNNPTAMLAAYVTRDKTWYIIDELYEAQMTTDEIAEKAHQWTVEYGIRNWYPDPRSPDRIESLRRAGVNTRKPSTNVLEGINSVRELLREKRLVILPKCKNLIEEMRMYHYAEPTGSGNEDEKPVKQYDHAVDALRYMVHSYHPSSMDVIKSRVRERVQRDERPGPTKQYKYL